MRFSTFVIIPATVSALIETVTNLMASYDAERPVLPYRVDVPSDVLEAFLAQQQETLLDDRIFCDRLSDWYGEVCFHDEQGYFCLSSSNPKGHWDGWMLHDVQTDVYLLPDTSIQTLDPLAIVTPDGIWHELSYQWDETTQQTAQRHRFAQQLFDQYLAHVAVLLDCHY